MQMLDDGPMGVADSWLNQASARSASNCSLLSVGCLNEQTEQTDK